MTVVVKLPDGRIKVMSKGADSIIQERLAETKQDQELMSKTEKYLDTYAGSGLRTLLLAEKEISVEDLETFRQEHKTASQAMSSRDERVGEVADRLERGFHLVGTTAIEDKL